MTEFYFRSGNEENGDCVFHRYTISLVGVSAQLFFITDVRIIEVYAVRFQLEFCFLSVEIEYDIRKKYQKEL
jgi:hypothetical protein